jgi:putative transposase
MLIEKDHPLLSVVRKCNLLQVSRSGLYYRPVPESEDNLRLMRILDEQYLNTPFYGLKLLLPLLVGLGYKINIKRLRRLMGLQGWQTLYPKPRTTKVDAAAYKYPYLLKGLEVNRNNQV